MFLYEDLLTCKYKPHGRDPRTGLDCYGLALECCKRAGTPLHDLYYERDTVPSDKLQEYIEQGANVAPIPYLKVGALALMEFAGRIHIGYAVSKTQILHATINRGVILSHISALNVIQWYEVK